MTATIEKQTTAGEIYKEAYFNVRGDKRAIELFLKEVIDIAEKQMNKSEI
jgi:hypothetical protein